MQREWEPWTPSAGPQSGRSGIDLKCKAVIDTGAPFTQESLCALSGTNMTAAHSTPREMALAGSHFEMEVCNGKKVTPRLLRLAR